VTQGTSTPTHYRIAYDGSHIPQEAIAQFTYEQCYNYPNWFGSVRFPGCLQSADKLSKLVGEHIREDLTTSELLKTHFYI
jgi:aubergine